MKFYENMEYGENLEWCKPISCKDGKIVVAINNGRVVSMQIDGEDVDATAENITRAARIANDYYNDYEGYDDAHILEDARTAVELGCAQCPWRDVCEAMEVDE